MKPESTTTPKELFYQETIETNRDGKAVSSNLKTGYYEIVESKAPTGYVSTTEVFYLKVQGGKATRIKKVDGTPVNSWPDENDNSGIIRFTPARKAQEADPEHGIEAQEASNASFLVGNTPAYELPSAGGPGVMLFTFFGTMLLALAGAGTILMIKRRRILV